MLKIDRLHVRLVKLCERSDWKFTTKNWSETWFHEMMKIDFTWNCWNYVKRAWMRIHYIEQKWNMIQWSAENWFHVNLLKLHELSVNGNLTNKDEVKCDSVKCRELNSSEFSEITWIKYECEFLSKNWSEMWSVKYWKLFSRKIAEIT